MLTTILHRPYVFAFLFAFLILGRLYWGWRKTFLWLVIGYVIAWASEFSSIHNGFPYGLYYYRYENMVGELMVFGVPFWDSLSYPFMIFAGYTTAQFLCGNPKSPALPAGRQIPNPNLRTYAPFDSLTLAQGMLTHLRTAFLGALLTMLLDIIIDPLTVLGDRWFLGNIYYYPHGGQYFGVPLTNFAGWFVVPLAVILVFELIVRAKRSEIENQVHVFRLDHSHEGSRSKCIGFKHFLPPLFYLSIALFNIAITMWIGETLLASIDCLILTPVVGILIWRIKRTIWSSTLQGAPSELNYGKRKTK